MFVNGSDIVCYEGETYGIALISLSLIGRNSCLVSDLLLERSGRWQNQSMPRRVIQS
jgi:hypothetical protein